jgi:beta-galactosidase GanA
VRCSDRITEALGKRFGRNPNVVAWQLDNEAACHDALLCYCAGCENELLMRNTPRRDAAMLHTYDDLLLALIHGQHVGVEPNGFIGSMIPLYRALERRGVGVTFARPTDDLTPYTLVLAPATFIMTADVARLGPVATAREEEKAVRGDFAGAWGAGEFACRRAQSLVPTGEAPAEIVATFGSHDLNGAAAATRKRFGEGEALFVGVSRAEEAALGVIVDRILADTALETCAPDPEDLQVIRGDLLTGYLNLSDSETLAVELPCEMTDVVTGRRMKTLELEPCGAAVLENRA